MLDTNTTPRQLSTLLGTTYPNLCFTVYKVRPNNLYTTFKIAKKSGGVRAIAAPDKRLKYLQNNLKPLLEDLYTPHPAATAFIKNRGIFYNASPHVNKALVFNVDLTDFYGHINFGRVRGLLSAPPYNLRSDTSQIIATICCLNGSIPQGAPTSPVISNMISRQLDRRLSLLAKKNHAFYTRYADDITFSFRNNNFKGVCSSTEGAFQPSNEFINIVEKSGFYLNKQKTRGEFSRSRQIVTGLKVNKKVNVDRRYIRTTKAMIHALSGDIDAANVVFWEKFPEKEPKRLEKVVAGRINFIGMIKGVDSTVYQMLAKKFNRLPLKKKLPTRTSKLVNTDQKYRDIAKQRELQECVWILDFEGVQNVTEEAESIQGTAFMVKDQKVLTCSHVFSKADDAEYCYISRINERSVKYLMKVAKQCKHRDIVELEFVDNPNKIFQSLDIYHKEEMFPGYQVSLVGFPDNMAGHTTVSVLKTSITSHVNISTVDNYEVDAEIGAGYSGGPVINDFHQVIGMIVKGRTTTVDFNTQESALTGRNAFISAHHFLQL
ncbi:trypsin-like peptidase domain-containing protein [Halomonas qaidamensis]|uniref:RNA-directed DNA polymerase n=1 Tax=Halomonas qaidamensis TaxID=2866211 RepID=A0ABY6JN54_9GAMM|nr:reverse transcriptase domain-containing protein [Halomonas qaidamensis]UYV18220.1 trypsin-like peptidase domain-containing protein [Halomonas qaidamensis]